jgi:hypothetical protein
MFKLLKILTSLLVFIVLVDPGDQIFHLKMLLFISIFIVWPFTLNRFFNYSKNIILFSFFVGIIIPAYSFLIGAAFSDTFIMQYGIMYFKAFLFFLLLIITVHSNIKIEKFLIKNAVFVALLTIVLYYIMLFYNTSLYRFVAVYFYGKEAAFTFLPWTQRQYGPFIIKILFYKTSPVLVFPLAYYLFIIFNGKNNSINKTVNLFLILLFFLALLISGTRANILSALLLVLIYFFSHINRSNKIYLKFLVILPTVALAIFFVVPFVNNIFFNVNEHSNQIKSEHLYSYIELFKDDPITLISGQGIGSQFYSFGIHRYTHQTELTYFELIRMLGLPMALIFFIILLLPFYIYYRNRKEGTMMKNTYLIRAYFFYLFIVGTNPLLLGSTGMLVLVCVFTSIFRTKYLIETTGEETLKTNFYASE